MAIDTSGYPAKDLIRATTEQIRVALNRLALEGGLLVDGIDLKTYDIRDEHARAVCTEYLPTLRIVTPE